jgi:FkbM family methyltransferase
MRAFMSRALRKLAVTLNAAWNQVWTRITVRVFFVNLLPFVSRVIQLMVRRYITKRYEVTYAAGFPFKIALDLRKTVDSFIYLGIFENDSLELFSRCLAEGMTVFDIGANIGLYTLMASHKVGNAGMVYAFEPSAWAMGRLEKNVSDFGRGNVKLIKAAVGDREGPMCFNITEDDAYNSLGGAPMKKIIAKETIDVVSLDSFIVKEAVKGVDVIKCDAEGADYLVFKGASLLLEKWSPLLFFEFNPQITEGFPFPPDKVLYFLDAHGYELFEVVRNKLVQIADFRPRGFEIIGIKREARCKFGLIRPGLPAASPGFKRPRKSAVIRTKVVNRPFDDHRL